LNRDVPDPHHTHRMLGVVSSSRRFMRIGLGALWVIDGALQLQPAMFTPSFPVNVVGPALQSLPNPIYEYSLSILQTYIIPHISIWNTLFAFLQLLIGVLILSNRHTLRTLGLTLSLVWSGFLWVFAEGLGGIYASTMSGGVFPGHTQPTQRLPRRRTPIRLAIHPTPNTRTQVET